MVSPKNGIRYCRICQVSLNQSLAQTTQIRGEFRCFCHAKIPQISENFHKKEGIFVGLTLDGGLKMLHKIISCAKNVSSIDAVCLKCAKNVLKNTLDLECTYNVSLFNIFCTPLNSHPIKKYSPENSELRFFEVITCKAVCGRGNFLQGEISRQICAFVSISAD